MVLACPACGSDDVRKLTELWDEIRSETPAAAALETAIAAQVAAAGSANGAHDADQVRSLVMHELAPPQKHADLPIGGSCLHMSAGILMAFAGFAMVIVAALRLAASHLNKAQVIVVSVFGLAVAVVGYVIGKIGAPKATYKEYAARLEAWQCSFRCMQCGNHFAVDPEA